MVTEGDAKFPDRIAAGEIEGFFPRRERSLEDFNDGLKGRTIEIGLVLAGTASAGAYTAGVLDFLVEALDAWQAAGAAHQPDVPTHRVLIGTIAGASGGAINGALLTKLAAHGFPHGSGGDGNPASPFLELWRAAAEPEDFLATSDAETRLVSLLNTERFEAIADRFLKAEPTSTLRRNFLASPLRFAPMIGNATGIPYKIDLQGTAGFGHAMVAHADYLRFARDLGGAPFNRPDPKADQVDLVDDGAWSQLGTAAMASGAFPGVFPGRPVTRPIDYLRYRAVVVPSDVADGPPDIRPLVPDWSVLGPLVENGSFKCNTMDGGVFDNEPIGFVHRAVAGMTGRNPRDARSMNRTILLIDPFAETVDLGPQEPPPLHKALAGLVGALIQQARFKPEDTALASDETVYSRFLIAPVSASNPEGDRGAEAIAGGGLGSFMALLHPDLMRFDFELGRYNAYAFLMRHFAVPHEPLAAEDRPGPACRWQQSLEVADLPRPDAEGCRFRPDNAVLRGLSQAELAKLVFADKDPATGEPAYWYRLVPLYGTAATPPPAPVVPVIPRKDVVTKAALGRRFDTLLRLLRKQVDLGGIVALYLYPAIRLGRRKAVNAVHDAILDALAGRGMLGE